jgi:hypothetical protein
MEYRRPQLLSGENLLKNGHIFGQMAACLPVKAAFQVWPFIFWPKGAVIPQVALLLRI